MILHTPFGADPIKFGNAIYDELEKRLSKAKERCRVLGENYPVYYEDTKEEKND